MISQILQFSKIALLTAKHFDGKVSERCNDFFVCVCTHARGKGQIALYKSAYAWFYKEAYRDKLKTHFKCLMGFTKLPMAGAPL